MPESSTASSILVLRWTGSAHDFIGGILELAARELAAEGHEVLLFVAGEDAADGDKDWPARLVRVLNQNAIAFALTMSGIGTDLRLGGKSLWAEAKVPLFNWNCDHPVYFPARHAIRDPFLLHGYVFPDHARDAIALLNPNGMAFAAHMGIPPRALFADAPLTERNGRLLFTKNGHDPNAIEARWRRYGPDLSTLLLTAAEELFHRATADFLPVLLPLAERHGLFLNGGNHLMLQLIRELDTCIRFRRATLVVESLLRHPVDVFGTGWEHVAWEGARARHHGPAPWRSIFERLPRYTASLSINPLVEDSVHDRVFFALAAGVTPIGDANAFTCAHMPALEPYTFTFHPDRVVQAADAALDRPAEALARTEDTWRAMAETFGMRRSLQQIARFARTPTVLNASFRV